VRQRANLRAVLLVGAIAATSAGFSQSRFGADADRRQQIIERIEQEEKANGPYSEGLIGPLSDLALLYQDGGDHDLAVAVIDRVRHVVRANEGLHSLEQIPLIQQMIANEEAIGRVDAAWELEQDLLTLARRHPGDVRTVPVFRETAAKRMALLRQYLAGESPPQIILGCYYGWPRADGATGASQPDFNVAKGDCTSGTKEEAIRAIVSDAQTSYAHAIAVMLRNELYSSDELRELELDLLRSFETLLATAAEGTYRSRAGAIAPVSFSARTDLEPWRSWKDAMLQLAEWELPQPGAASGPEKEESPKIDPRLEAPNRAPSDAGIVRRSLERLLAYEIAASAPLQEQIEAFMRIADSELPNSGAFERYELVRKTLEEAGAEASIDELFSPTIPVVLPTYVPNPLASDATRAVGYIDVAFEIGRYGRKGERVRILDTTANATDTEKARLVQLIENSRFRPRLTDGEFARASPVVLRYYLTE
jgi:hypothetical protein